MGSCGFYMVWCWEKGREDKKRSFGSSYIAFSLLMVSEDMNFFFWIFRVGERKVNTMYTFMYCDVCIYVFLCLVRY